MFNLTPAAKNILIINGIIFIITNQDVIEFLGMRYILSENFKPFQMLTYMWVHANFLHLFSNMFAVLVFAPILEKVWGSKKFFVFYLLTGIGAGILYCGINFAETYKFEKDTENYVYVKKIAMLLANHQHINIEDFFNAPYEVYPDDANRVDLKFYTSLKATSVYSIYKKKQDDMLPDEQTDRVKDSLFFIYNF